MFLRSVKAPNGRHQYLRLVESVFATATGDFPS